MATKTELEDVTVYDRMMAETGKTATAQREHGKYNVGDVVTSVNDYYGHHVSFFLVVKTTEDKVFFRKLQKETVGFDPMQQETTVDYIRIDPDKHDIEPEDVFDGRRVWCKKKEWGMSVEDYAFLEPYQGAETCYSD